MIKILIVNAIYNDDSIFKFGLAPSRLCSCLFIFLFIFFLLNYFFLGLSVIISMWSIKKFTRLNELVSAGGRLRYFAVGLSNAEMSSLNSTLLSAIVTCSELVRPYTLNEKLMLPCNTSTKFRWEGRLEQRGTSQVSPFKPSYVPNVYIFYDFDRFSQLVCDYKWNYMAGGGVNTQMYTLRVFWPNNGCKHFFVRLQNDWPNMAAGPRNMEVKKNNIVGIINVGSSDRLDTATVLI